MSGTVLNARDPAGSMTNEASGFWGSYSAEGHSHT